MPKVVLRTVKPGKLLTKYDKLNDWVSLLLDFRVAQKRSKPSKGAAKSQNVHIVLSKWVVHESHSGRLSAIATNFFGAAMHLSYLLLHPFPENQLPELCSCFDALSDVRLTAATQSTQELTATVFTTDEVKFWKGVFGEEDNKRERLPLQLALLVSPICLLMPIQIFKNKYGKENIVQTSIALGNQRPPTLVSVERALWTVLFDTATGLRHPESALEHLATCLSWDDIQACSSEDRAWFQLSSSSDRPSNAAARTAASSGTSANVQLLSHNQPSSIIYINPSTAGVGWMDVDSSGGPGISATAASQRELNMLLASGGNIGGIRSQQLGGTNDTNPPSRPITIAQQPLCAALASEDPQQATNSTLVDVARPHEMSSVPYCTTLATSGTITKAPTISAPVAELPVAVDGFRNRFPVGSLNIDVSKHSRTRDEMDVSMVVEGGELGLGSATVEEEAEGEANAKEKQGFRVGVEHDDDDVEEDVVEQLEKGGVVQGEREKEEGDHPGVQTGNHRRQALSSEETAFKTPRPLRSTVGVAAMYPNMSQSGLLTRRSSRQKPQSDTTPSTTSHQLNISSTVGDKRKRSDTLIETKLLNAPQKAQRSLSGRRRPRNGKGRPHVGEAGTREDPIRVDVDAYCVFGVKKDEFEQVDTNLQPLCPQGQSRRVTTISPVNVWDTELKWHSLFPRFHHKQELVKFVRIMDSVSDNYINGFPRHVAEPSTSLFRMVDFSDYKKLEIGELNDILRKQCIVVRNMPWDKLGFDQDGLETLSPFDAVTSVQDLSLTPRNDGSDRIQNGTLKQMLQSSSSGSRAKALNALSFPFTSGNATRSCFDYNPHATCRIAWDNTSGTVFKCEVPMPLGDLHWGLAATAGAMTWWHMNSDGFGTTVDVRTGSKVWIVGSDEEEKFSMLGLLLTEPFGIDPPPKGFRTEAVLLTPGTRLIMRPGMVHAVFTPDDSICHGGHFYSTPTMQATLVSLIHGFVCHRVITNMSRPLTRVLIRRTLHYYHRGLVLEAEIKKSDRVHLPDLDVPPNTHVKVDEAINLLCVCYMVLCTNVLDPRTYMVPGQGKDTPPTAQQSVFLDQYDLNDIPLDERRDICKSRGACLEVLAWFRKCFVVTAKGSDAAIDLVSVLFFQLSRSLLRYKYAAEVNRVEAAGGCKLHHMRCQLESSLALDKETWDLWSAQEKDFWMDDEMRDAKRVEALDRGADPEAASSQEEDEVEGLCMDLEERELDSGADRRIDVGRETRSSPDLLADVPKWRLDTLLLENKGGYSVVRRDIRHRPHKIDVKCWRKAGRNSFDEAFFAGVDFRNAIVALGVNGHIAKLGRENE